MLPTIKAILARCDHDPVKAFAYCRRMMSQSSNPHFRAEYAQIAKTIWDNAGKKAEAAHV